MKRIALVGSGGTGKSSLLELFKADGYKVFPSITREFYERMGIKDESAYMALPKDEQAGFQRRMRVFYQMRYNAFVNENEHENIITDRSILDHLAYGIYGIHGQFSITTLGTVIDTCIAFSNTAYTNLIFLPYPQPWMLKVSIEDGFRNVDPAKNYCIHSLMLATLYYHKKVQQDLLPELSILKRSTATPEETYQMIREVIHEAET
jgi:predicted ATPase